MLLLAWGRNLMWFTELAFDLLPGYNKFRTVSMALVVVQWAVPLLGALALMRLWRGEIPRQRLLRALAWAAGVTGGLCLLLAVAGSAFFDFGRAESTGMMTEQFRQLFEANNMQDYLQRGMDAEMGIATGNAMAAERASMMQADAWRSLLMILLAAGGVALFALRRINKYVLTALLAAVMLLDLVPVDLRFISHDNFISARRNQVTATAADKAIMADKEPGFRVFNLTVSPFQDATTSYFHRSVGGYHGAKLARYQDLIDRYLSYRNDAVLDMLNTRYLIVPGDGGQPEAVLRPTANGAAWFVDAVAVAGSPQQEIDLLGETDLKRTAVIAEKDKSYTEGWTANPADTATQRTIALTEYRPNYLRYEYTAPARGRGGILRNLLSLRLDGLRRRRGSPLFPGRLRAPRHEAACRATYRRMEIPRPGLEGGRSRDAHLVAHDPARRHRGGGLLFQIQEEREKRERGGIKRVKKAKPQTRLSS